MNSLRSGGSRWLAALVVWAGLAWNANAQGTGGPTVSDTRVGYITGAVPFDHIRLRYDSAYRNTPFTSRAEYFYAASQPIGPGLPKPERSVDYQDLSLYGEAVIGSGWSLFGELGLRWLNPEINENAMGLGDMTVGTKWAFAETEDAVWSFLLRGYIPTGEAGRGLGTRHYSVEPGLLGLYRLNESWNLEGELTYWVPIGGSDFAGSIVRYGLGVSYNLWDDGERSIAPVIETVGWTAVDGLKSSLQPDGVPLIEGAGGDTIINLKLGLRGRIGPNADMYVGWGHALTDQRWYQDIIRVEFRIFR
jgi:hypothetical protein